MAVPPTVRWLWGMRRLHGAKEVQKHQIEKFNIVRCMRHMYGVGVSVTADI